MLLSRHPTPISISTSLTWGARNENLVSSEMKIINLNGRRNSLRIMSRKSLLNTPMTMRSQELLTPKIMINHLDFVLKLLYSQGKAMPMTISRRRKRNNLN